MKNVLVWEVLSEIGGGQKISIMVGNMLKKNYNPIFLIPSKGELSEELERLNIQYILFPSINLNSGKKNKSDVFNYFLRSIKLLRTVLNIITDYNIEIIYAPGPNIMPIAAIAGNIKNKPVIWHIHHIFEDRKTIYLLNFTGKFNSVKRIITVSDIAAEQFNDIKIIEKTITLYNPIDIDRFKCEDGIEKKELNIPEKSFVIANIGFLQKGKNQLASINAVNCLIKDGYDVHLMIIGESRPNDNEYELILKNAVFEYGIEDRVHFLYKRSDVYKLFKSIDATAVMGIEGFSLVALESMASGKPVIGINKAGVAEIIKKSNAGLLVSDNNLNDEYVKMIKYIIDNPERIKYLKDNGIKFAEKNNTIQYQNNLLDIFEQSYPRNM